MSGLLQEEEREGGSEVSKTTFFAGLIILSVIIAMVDGCHGSREKELNGKIDKLEQKLYEVALKHNQLAQDFQKERDRCQKAHGIPTNVKQVVP